MNHTYQNRPNVDAVEQYSVAVANGVESAAAQASHCDA